MLQARQVHAARAWTQQDIEACVDEVINARDEGLDEGAALADAAWGRRLNLDQAAAEAVMQAVNERWYGAQQGQANWFVEARRG